MDEKLIKQFIEDYPNTKKNNLLRKYNLSQSQYEMLRRKYNLKKAKTRAWTEEDIKYIRQHPDMKVTELAKKMNRCPTSVHEKCRIYGLRNNLEKSKPKKLTNETDYIMCLWWLHGDNFHDIAFLFACSEEDVKNALKNKRAMTLALKNRKRGMFELKRTKEEIIKFTLGVEK